MQHKTFHQALLHNTYIPLKEKYLIFGKIGHSEFEHLIAFGAQILELRLLGVNPIIY